MNSKQRDFVGYADALDSFKWPNKYKIAINFIINYESGAERNILDGDAASESYLVDIPEIQSLKNQRHLSSESMFEYGSRTGIWRITHLFDKHQVPLTFFVCGLALERNPLFANYLKKSQHEVAGHGYRWIDYGNIPLAMERKHILKTIRIIESATNKKVYGWYTGRKSVHTRDLIVENNLLYDSDSYSDDLPYWLNYPKKAHLVIPYNLENNDLHYITGAHFNSPNDFLSQLIFNFDYLYEESKKHATLMTIGLHERISGKPARTEALRRFLHYVLQHKKVWLCRRQDIANFWHQHYFPKEKFL